MVQKLLGVARILGRDQVNITEGLDRPKGHVIEVANRGRHQVEVACLLIIKTANLLHLFTYFALSGS